MTPNAIQTARMGAQASWRSRVRPIFLVDEIVNAYIMDVELEFRQLRYFVALADELHFGRAAARLRIAQPALSQAMRRLEQRLGFTLLARTSRRVDLTRQGAAFLASTRRVLDEVQRGVETGRDIAAGKVGNVTLGHTALAMITVLPAILRRFRERHPTVRLAVRELPSAVQIEHLRAGYVDAAIVTGRFAEDELSWLELRRDALVALLPPGHPLGRRRKVSVASLAREPFILFPREQIPSVYDQIVKLCRASGFDPDMAQLAQSWQMIAALVGVGLGVSIVPAPVKRYAVAGVRCVPLSPTTTMPTALYWRSDVGNIPAQLFISTTRDVFRRA